MTQFVVRPHHVIPQLLPVRPRPHHHERTGSYLIRLAQANHCLPWSFLRLLGRIPSGGRADLVPTAAVTMNQAALTRLAAYLGKNAGELTRALPWITAEERWDEPTILIRRPTRTLLRSCHRCEKRAGGASLMPNPHPLQLSCARHNTWLITDESIDLARTPDVAAALNALRKISRRHGDDLTHAHYQLIRKHLTDDCRGQGWHRHLTQRWIERQRLQHPTSSANDQFVRAHTQHWSMLPETTALIRLLTKARPGDATLLNTTDIKNALNLHSYWATHPAEPLNAMSFHPLGSGGPGQPCAYPPRLLTK